MSGDYSKEVTPVPMPNTEVKLLSVDGSRTYVPLVETVRSLFLCLKRQNKKQTQRKMAWRSENV